MPTPNFATPTTTISTNLTISATSAAEGAQRLRDRHPCRWSSCKEHRTLQPKTPLFIFFDSADSDGPRPPALICTPLSTLDRDRQMLNVTGALFLSCLQMGTSSICLKS
ncbi:hypothetical protein AAC387_Pa08g1726 [Persea americana]